MFRSVIFLLTLVFASTGAVFGPQLEPKVSQKSDFSGDWLRSDGTYRFEVEIRADAVEARYFNPVPVNVESARFVDLKGQPQLVVVLRDQGYDGSTYELVYLPEHDVLIGLYARPGSAPAEVYFTRVQQ